MVYLPKYQPMYVCTQVRYNLRRCIVLGTVYVLQCVIDSGHSSVVTANCPYSLLPDPLTARGWPSNLSPQEQELPRAGGQG